MDIAGRRRRLGMAALAVVVAAWLPAVAVAQGADALALTIEQNLSSIEFRMDLRPAQAASDLEAQGRQLELLEQEAPDHPDLPGLKQRYADLQDALATALSDAADRAAGGAGAGQVPTAPEAFTAGMDEVASLQQQAEAELMSGRPAEANAYLDQAEAQMAALEERYREQIPQGNVPLLVAKEKLAVLKDQIAAAKPN
jgi:hypothetical protein